MFIMPPMLPIMPEESSPMSPMLPPISCMTMAPIMPPLKVTSWRAADARSGSDSGFGGKATGQSGAFTTGQLIAVVGDFSYYKIRDRIGMTVENVPHLFGAAQGNLPTGQRGLFAYWRVGAKVANANAFRTLKLA